jgi:hypothetical protein
VFPSVNVAVAPFTVTVPLESRPAPLTASEPAVISIEPLNVFAPLNVTSPLVVFVNSPPPLNCVPIHPFSTW